MRMCRENAELRRQLIWLVRLRWIGITGVLAVSWAATATGFFSFSLVPVYGILCFTTAYNILSHRLAAVPAADLRSLSVTQILLDQVALALAVYFSGGCDSPFIIFFIFHVVISGVILPRRFAFAFAGIAVLLPAAVMGLKHWGVLRHYGIFRNEPAFSADPAMMASYGAIYTVTVFLTAYFVTHLSGRLEQSRSELQKNNVKLATLLDASRLTTSTLELEGVLSSSLRIILNVTHLRVGVIMLLEDEAQQRCHEFFNCNAYNCPAYKTEMNCWRLMGTLCHGDAGSCPDGLETAECWRTTKTHSHGTAVHHIDGKLRSCTSCDYFTRIVLVPRMETGLQDESCIGARVAVNGPIHRALVQGRTVVDYSRSNPFRLSLNAATELAMPLIMRDELIGILYLVSDRNLRYTEEDVAFFHVLSEVVSSGILNSKLYTELEDSYLQTIMALENVVEAKDPYTRGHSKRVSDLCLLVADALGFSKQEKDHLRYAALLHDVGKIGINGEILGKQSSLDEDEMAEMRSHTDRGMSILMPVHFLKPILPAVLHHHENYDGTGYPHGLTGRQIPYKARIIKVADAWDAMRSDRPYRKALSVKEARAELIRCSGMMFDPDVTAIFLNLDIPALAKEPDHKDEHR